MAFSKVSIVLLALVVEATLAEARVDHFESEVAGHTKVWCSYNCDCRIEDGTTKCYHTDFKTSYSRECPSSCKDRCICDFKSPSTCRCSHEVDCCCGLISPFGTETRSGNLLGLIKKC